MLVVEISQKLVESQIKSIKLQLVEVGIRVLIKMTNGKRQPVGWVDTLTGTGPFKVKVRLDEENILPKGLPKGLKFTLNNGRFILTK